MTGFFASIVIFVFSVAQTDKNVHESNDFDFDSIVEKERTVSGDNKGLDINAVVGFDYEQFLLDDNLLGNRRNFRMKKLRGKPRIEHHYMAVINLANLFWSDHNNKIFNYNSNSLIIGFKKPFYRLSRYPRVRGSVDMRFEATAAGLQNSAIITLAYDFEGSSSHYKFKSSFYLERVSLNVLIPFGEK